MYCANHTYRVFQGRNKVYVCVSFELQEPIKLPVSYTFFSKEHSSRTKLSRDMKIIRKKREFYLDYHEIVSSYNSRTEKRSVGWNNKKNVHQNSQLSWFLLNYSKISSHDTSVKFMLSEEKSLFFSMQQISSVYLNWLKNYEHSNSKKQE